MLTTRKILKAFFTRLTTRKILTAFLHVFIGHMLCQRVFSKLLLLGSKMNLERIQRGKETRFNKIRKALCAIH